MGGALLLSPRLGADGEWGLAVQGVWEYREAEEMKDIEDDSLDPTTRMDKIWSVLLLQLGRSVSAMDMGRDIGDIKEAGQALKILKDANPRVKAPAMGDPGHSGKSDGDSLLERFLNRMSKAMEKGGDDAAGLREDEGQVQEGGDGGQGSEGEGGEDLECGPSREPGDEEKAWEQEVESTREKNCSWSNSDDLT